MNRWTIHVVDTDPNSASSRSWLEDVSKVEKYMMPDVQYDMLDNTIQLRALKKKMYGNTKEAKHQEPKIEDFTIGSRCIINPGAMRGEIRFV